jgi:hypothetical protein
MMTYNSSDIFRLTGCSTCIEIVQYSRYYPYITVVVSMNSQSLCLLLLGSVVHPKLRHGFEVEVNFRRGGCIKTLYSFVSTIPSDMTRLEKKTSVKMRQSSMQGGVTAFLCPSSHVRSRLSRTQVYGELHIAEQNTHRIRTGCCHRIGAGRSANRVTALLSGETCFPHTCEPLHEARDN